MKNSPALFVLLVAVIFVGAADARKAPEKHVGKYKYTPPAVTTSAPGVYHVGTYDCFSGSENSAPHCYDTTSQLDDPAAISLAMDDGKVLLYSYREFDPFLTDDNREVFHSFGYYLSHQVTEANHGEGTFSYMLGKPDKHGTQVLCFDMLQKCAYIFCNDKMGMCFIGKPLPLPK